MNFTEKAKIRIEHWLSHNESHVSEYENFIEELEKEGKQACAGEIREMVRLTVKSNDSLRKSLKAL